MTSSSLLRLMTWLSPSYPVGAYTYSHGLEAAVELGYITNISEGYDWLKPIITSGAGQADVVFLHHAYHAARTNDAQGLYDCAELASAFCNTKELALETQAQGKAFWEITQKSWFCRELEQLAQVWPGPYSYPVVVGVAAAGHSILLQETALAYLHGFTANLISALVRLVPLGQTDGQILMARLEPLLVTTVQEALDIKLQEISNATLRLDMMSMYHETQHTRLFRS